MSYSFIHFEILKNGVAKLSLNRPEVLNSFHQEMSDECIDAIGHCHGSNVRVLVLTGAGRAFCCGQDLAALGYDENEDVDLEQIVLNTYNPLIRAIRDLPKPVVAFVNGVAAGAGANIALACDLVIAAESARFIQAFQKVGLAPDSGASFLLPRIVGEAKAKELLLLGEPLSGKEAEELNLIYKCYPDKEAAGQVMSLAERLASSATAALGYTKLAIHAGTSTSFEDHLGLEAKLQGLAGATSDHKEGVRAFLEKRSPRFTGA